MTSVKTTITVTHVYEISSKESRIDEHENNESERERFHRMFQVLMSSLPARQTIMEFLVLENHWIEGGASFNFVEERFGHDARFFDVLFQLRTIFAPIDQAWLQALKQEEGNEEDAYQEEDEHQRAMHRQARRIYRRQHVLYPLLVALGGTDIEFEQQAPQLTDWAIHLGAAKQEI